MLSVVLCGQNKPKQNPLSPRETEILELLAQGFAKKEAADKTGISYHTVSFLYAAYSKNLKAPT